MSHAVRRVAAPLGLAAILLGGCVVPDAGEGGQRQPEAGGDDGVQASGTLDGRRISISNGAPDVVIGDCDPGVDLDDDVCFVTRTIDGDTIAVVIENPAVLTPGEAIDIVRDPCTTCDDVTTGAVVEIRVNGAARRVDSGRLEVIEAGERYAADFVLDFRGGDRLVGSFNVRQLGPGES